MRGKGYQILEHPQIQRVLAHPPTASVTSTNTGEVVDLFDGGGLALDEGLSQVRVIVARHPAPAPGKSVTVGKRVDAWVWNLRLSLGQTMQGGKLREIKWAPPKESPPFFLAAENPPEEYGP